MQVFITGVGIISGLGTGITPTVHALKNALSGISTVVHLTPPKTDLLAAEVKQNSAALKDALHIPQEKKLSRTSLLGIAAAREALQKLDAALKKELPFISSTTTGGMDVSESFYRNYLKQEGKADFTDLLTHDCGDSTEKIAEAIGVNGFVTTISTACSSSANTLMLAGRMLRSGRAKRALAGGADALTHFTLNGFRSLMIYDKELCRPFDNNRAGLNLGEGAAYLLLETEDSLKETGNTPLGILAGWGNANDAYHQTASSPEGTGATTAMQLALESAGIKPDAISYVNAHGTGTPNNDLSESKALINVFGNNIPPFSSTKSFTGHTLAAAGAIEAVFSVTSLQQNLLLPNLHFKNVIEETRLTPVTEAQQERNLQYVLSNSFGFGGNNTSLVFQKA